VAVPLRDAWPGEATDFTPWLAGEENLALLGDVLGLELELIDTEKDVGPYRADIVCKDTADGSWVLVENQLDKTDHTHLGQILTYAAGLSAVHVVWVAKRFTDEHRAALDWLNENTNENLRFFGLEIELWRIGGSFPAPKFNVVCSPNDWVKGAAARTANSSPDSPTKSLQLEFWRAFCAFCEEQPLAFRTPSPRPRHWMSIALGRSGFKLSAIASCRSSLESSQDTWEVRAEFFARDGEVHLSALEAQREEIESELGFQLTWYNPEDKRMGRASICYSVDLADRKTWPGACAWLADHLDRMHRVLGPRVKAMS
jgi:hypothetical protein